MKKYIYSCIFQKPPGHAGGFQKKFPACTLVNIYLGPPRIHLSKHSKFGLKADHTERLLKCMKTLTCFPILFKTGGLVIYLVNK